MKALALFSGGLDSALAIKIIQEQNIDIEGVYIDIGFESNKNKIEELRKSAKELNIKLTVLDIKQKYIDNILFNPVYGYGKNFNPCIDCHANMIKTAKEYMDKTDAEFIISGEVLGQRPMSQRKDALNAVNKLSGANGLVLRPLSAKLLPATVPEQKGWIDRDRLFAIQGRDRKIQLELAEKYNLQHFESPAGGCLLTDINFSKRLKNFTKYLQLTPYETDILKAGRHFDIEGYKIIISRNADENPVLKNYKGKLFAKMFTKGFPGPVGLIQKNSPAEIKQLSADMMISYTKSEEGEIIINNEIFYAKKKNKQEFSQYII